MTRLAPLVPADMDDAQRALYEVITGGPRNSARLIAEDGSLRGPFDPMLRSPAVGEPLQALGAAIRFGATLPADRRELAILATAVHWRCRFEWDAHLPIAVAAGLDTSTLSALWDTGAASFADETHGQIVEMVSEVFDRRTLSNESFVALVEVFGDAQAFELLAVVGYYSTLAILMNTFDIS